MHGRGDEAGGDELEDVADPEGGVDLRGGGPVETGAEVEADDAGGVDDEERGDPAEDDRQRVGGLPLAGEPLDDVFDRMNGRSGGPAERIFSAGMTEWRRSQRDDGGLIAGVLQRVERAMNVAIGREGDRLTRGLPFLATVGSTAPFIGLFGTVWGIKTAFEGIALSQDTSLAVVAPGIAEALVATALGLLAAIPAVIFYNKLSSDADRISAGHEAFADEFATILSRQVEDA